MSNFANYLVLLGIILGAFPGYWIGKKVGKLQAKKEDTK
jgi:membrane protein DedA with SNARE-associated domain